MGAVTTDFLKAWLTEFAEQVTANESMLTQLDSAIGDADHGANMKRGMAAVLEILPTLEEADAKTLLSKAGMTLVSKVGGASGPLYGTLFMRMGAGIGEAADVDEAAFGAALRAGLEGIVARGKCELEDKTMYDAFHPAVEAYDQALAGGSNLGAALAAAADAAEVGRDATTPLVAMKGRASYLGERSAGHQDPGATSLAMLLRAAVTAAST